MSAPHFADIAHDLVCEARGRECISNRDCPLWDGESILGAAPLDREIRESVPRDLTEDALPGMVPLPRAGVGGDVGELTTKEGASSVEGAPS